MKENDSKSRGNICIFWAKENNGECGIKDKGIYIPMPAHVNYFCLSSNYYKCKQYIKRDQKNESILTSDIDEFVGRRDRRRLRRYPEQLHLNLIVQVRNIGLKGMNLCKAKSLDISLGGLRVECSSEFAHDTVVSFVMNPEFSSDNLLGFGEVKWCLPKKGTDRYESGIAFSNYSTSENVREYLEI